MSSQPQVYRCASPECPGYPWKASDLPHPCPMTDHHDRTPPVASSQQGRTDAPERVWLQRVYGPDYRDWSWCWHRVDDEPSIPDMEYIRADIADAHIRHISILAARIRELEEALGDLVDEASWTWVALDRYGDLGMFEDNDNGATFRARRVLNRETTDE